MPADLNPRTLALLEDLPPFVADSYDVQGTLDALAREHERIEEARDTLVRNYFPQTADEYLSFFEELLKTTVARPGATLAQRRNTALAFLRRLKFSGSGLDWQGTVTALIGPGWTYEEHDPADGSSPPAHTVRITLPFTQALAPPSGLAAVAAAGGSLPAGTYYYRVTAHSTYGETTPSNEVSVVLSGTQRADLTWNAVADADHYSVYRGTASGAELRVATNVMTNAYGDLGAAAGTTPPPAQNTSESFQGAEARALLRSITPAHIVLDFGYEQGFILGRSVLGDVL